MLSVQKDLAALDLWVVNETVRETVNVGRPGNEGFFPVRKAASSGEIVRGRSD